MPRSDETFIVRVRAQDGDAVVEQPRLSRRRRVRHVADVGALITSWLDAEAGRAEPQRSVNDESASSSGNDKRRTP